MSVHHARDQTWHWQRLAGARLTPYGWVADRHGTTANRQWWIAGQWWHRAVAAHAHYAALASPALRGDGPPGWFLAAMPCVANAEESGSNSAYAGYFGIVYVPGTFGLPDATWLTVSYSEQEQVAWGIWTARQAANGDGWSAWGPRTRATCQI